MPKECIKNWLMKELEIIPNVPILALGRREVDSERYGGRCGYVKDDEIQGRVTVFLSGKLISTGAKSVIGSRQQLEQTRDILVREQFVQKIQLKPKIRNIVATAAVGGNTDLDLVTSTLPRLMFEPDQFPGAIYRTSEGPVCLIFASGKIVIIGATSEQQATTVESLILNTLEKFRS